MFRHSDADGSRTPRQRGVTLICLMVAGTQMTWGLVIPVMPVYVESLGAGPAALGGVVAAFGVGRLLINVPAGIATQHLNQRAMLVGSVAAVAAATFATALVTSVEQLLVLRLLTGVAGGVVITTGQAMLTHTDPAQMGRTMSALQAFQLAGGAIGPGLGGLLVGIAPAAPFVGAGGILTALFLVGLVRSAPVRIRDTPDPGPGGGGDGRGVWTPGLVAISLVGFTVFFVRFGGQQFLFPVLAYDRAGFTPVQLGIAITGTTLLSLVLVNAAGILTDRWGRRPTVIASTGLVGVMTLGFLGSGTPALFIASLVLTGIAMTLTGPASGAFLAESVPPRHRGTAVGIYRTCGDVAILVGPLSLGWLVEIGAADLSIVIMAVTAAVVTVVFALLTRKRTDPA